MIYSLYPVYFLISENLNWMSYKCILRHAPACSWTSKASMYFGECLKNSWANLSWASIKKLECNLSPKSIYPLLLVIIGFFQGTLKTVFMLLYKNNISDIGIPSWKVKSCWDGFPKSNILSETHYSELINQGLWADINKRKNTSSASSADDDSTVDVGQGRFLISRTSYVA